MSEPERRERNPHWPERLNGVIQFYQAEGFLYGRRDCGTFFADCVQALCGFDPLIDVKGYRDERTALRALKAAGFDRVEALVAARFAPVEPSMAVRGDLGYPFGQHDRLMSPAIITGAEAHCMTREGMAVIPRSLIVRAWAV